MLIRPRFARPPSPARGKSPHTSHLLADWLKENTCMTGIACDSLTAVDSGANGNGGLQRGILSGTGHRLGIFRRSAAAKKGQRALKRLYARSSATARRASDNRAEEVGFTRFFRNENVTVKEILETAAARTNQAAAGRHVLVIQDTSEINYQAKAGSKRNLGHVGNGTDAGLFVHPALAVDAEDGSVLGLAAATIWRRTKVKDQPPSFRMPGSAALPPWRRARGGSRRSR